jgi:hypothetical protein
MEKACKKLLKPTGYYIARNAQGRVDTPGAKEIAAILAKDESLVGSGYCQICSLCIHAHYGVAELGHLNPNVLLEIGLMFAFAKPVILTLDTRITKIEEVPFDIDGLLLIPYENYDALEAGLKNKLEGLIEMLKQRGRL